MVARKRTRKQLYSGGSNNNNTNKKELLDSIKSLLVQLKDTDDHHIQALRAALLFIRSAIEIKTKKASSNNKSLLTKASSATNIIGNSLLLNNQDAEFKSKLKGQINSMSGMEKSALVSDLFGTLKANDINQDTIRNLFIDKDRDDKFQLLAKLLILSGKSASIQMGGAGSGLMSDLGRKLNIRRNRVGPSNSNNTSSETMRFGSSDTQTPATTSLTGTSVNAKFEKPTRKARQKDINAVTKTGFVERMGDGLGLKFRTSPPTMPTSTKTNSTATSKATSNATATSKATSTATSKATAKATANAVVPDLSQSNESSNNSNRSTDTQVVPETETSSSMTSSSTQPQSSSKSKSSSNNNSAKIQRIQQLLTIDFLKSLMNDMSSSVVGGGSRKKNRSKKHKRRSSNKNKYSNKKKSSNKK